jgi:(2R)-3-sulfolactate dehydrogenase (NADP+)
MTITHPAAELEALAQRVLVAADTSAENARAVAVALVAAELDGIPTHGLARLPFYADQSACGKVAGHAVPAVTRPAKAVIRVDAGDGFAYPALDAGIAAAVPVARELGIAALGVTRSHHCGVLGYHVERIAREGLVSLFFSNTPAAIAPWGGKTALFGTDPIAFGCPRPNAPPLVVDVALSVAARGKIMVAASKGEAIPEGWALDADGNPTTGAMAALGGTLMALGGGKGAALALAVELLAAGLTGAKYGFEASSFFDSKGGPPGVGQLAILLDPRALGGEAAIAHCEELLQEMLRQPGVRLPGDRRLASRARLEAEGIALPQALFEELTRRASHGT